MSPLEPREAGNVVAPATSSTPSDLASGWTFQAWAIAIPLGILLLCFVGFFAYYWRHRKDIARSRPGPDAEQLPAYKPPLGEGKGGPPAYVMGQEQAAVEPSHTQDGLLPSHDGRADPADGPAEEQPREGEARGSVLAAPEPACLARASTHPRSFALLGCRTFYLLERSQ